MTIAPYLNARTRVAGRCEARGFDVASTNDIFTWALTFLDAEALVSTIALQQLSTMASEAGGGDDYVVKLLELVEK